MATYRNKNQSKKFYKINQYITAPEVRLVDADARQIGVVSIAEARRLSQESGKDLVEIAPLAKPPVVKLIEFTKNKVIVPQKLSEDILLPIQPDQKQS